MRQEICPAALLPLNRLDWYAIRVMSNFERSVATALKGKEFEVCLPMCRPASRETGETKRPHCFPGTSSVASTQRFFCRSSPFRAWFM